MQGQIGRRPPIYQSNPKMDRGYPCGHGVEDIRVAKAEDGHRIIVWAGYSEIFSLISNKSR